MTGSALFHCIMQRIANKNSIHEILVKHLPRPNQAQKYRTINLYTGACDDEVAIAMMECNLEGPSTLFISKFITCKLDPLLTPVPFAIGRVFSGSIRPGETMWLIPSDKTSNSTEIKVRKMFTMTDTLEELEVCSAGDIVLLSGLVSRVGKSATLSSLSNASALARINPRIPTLIDYGVECKKQIDIWGSWFETRRSALAPI